MSVTDLAKQRIEDFHAYVDKVAKVIEDRFNALKELTNYRGFEFKANTQIQYLQPYECASIFMDEASGDTSNSYKNFRISFIELKQDSSIRLFDKRNKHFVSDKNFISIDTLVFTFRGTIDDIIKDANEIIVEIGGGKVPQITQTELGMNPNKLSLAGSQDIWFAIQRREALDETGKVFAEKIAANLLEKGIVSTSQAHNLGDFIKFIPSSIYGAYKIEVDEEVSPYSLEIAKSLGCSDRMGLVGGTIVSTLDDTARTIKQWVESFNKNSSPDYKIDFKELPKLPTKGQEAGKAV